MLTEFKKFLKKYAGELGSITDAIGSIVAALPIGVQDKERVKQVLAGLDDAAANIIKSADKLKEPAKVTIKKSDIEAAVKEALPDIVRAIVVEEISKGEKDAPNSGE